MNKKQYIVLLLACVIGLMFAGMRNLDCIQQLINTYAQQIAEQQFGSESVTVEYEQLIRDIAREMNISESFEIRKMNPRAMMLFGYHNAFAYFPQFLSCIPIGNKSFLFVSQGFLEDVSPEEQRFLIGHEMVHIQEHHTQYLTLALYILFFMLLLPWWFATRNIRKLFGLGGFARYLSKCISGFLLCICLLIPNLIGFAYRRHIEWEADRTSLARLHTHEGGIKLMDRWQQEFKVPFQNNGWGLFADHPSIHDRKVYCMNTKHNKESFL